MEGAAEVEAEAKAAAALERGPPAAGQGAERVGEAQGQPCRALPARDQVPPGGEAREQADPQVLAPEPAVGVPLRGDRPEPRELADERLAAGLSTPSWAEPEAQPAAPRPEALVERRVEAWEAEDGLAALGGEMAEAWASPLAGGQRA